MIVLRAFLLVCPLLAVGEVVPMPKQDEVRVAEFYRLAAQIEDRLWPHWDSVTAPVLLIVQETEFLTHNPTLPAGFTPGKTAYASRPRQFPVNLEATFPAFGEPAAIVIGEPRQTASKTSTPWLIVLMHEHFHQLQYAAAGYQAAVDGLGLTGGDRTGMWMLNYPFPYSDSKTASASKELKEEAIATLSEADPAKFKQSAAAYRALRRRFLEELSENDRKYFSFQLWQEGMARYTQIKAAEAAMTYKPSSQFAALPDFTSFAEYGRGARSETIGECAIPNSRKREELLFIPLARLKDCFSTESPQSGKIGIFSIYCLPRLYLKLIRIRRRDA